ncbi:MAG: MCE family protein [Gammaproteobacteria bacterium]|nr:MCE family protein [Gammaproteobacteria bacterium]
MDTKINYSLIGILIFTLTLLMTLFLLWMGKYGFEETIYDHYLIKTTEGAAGLNIESPVKYRGVEIGAVDKIEINHENSEHIDISISVKLGTPIKEDNFAVLTAQGITGLSYIEIKGGTKSAKNLKSGSIIASGQSLFGKLETSATDISNKMIQTMVQIDKLISNKNIHSIEQLLVNLESSSRQLSEQMKLFLNAKNSLALEKTLDNTAMFTQVIADNKENIQLLLSQGITLERQANTTLNDISKTSHSLDTTMLIIQSKLNSGEYDLRQITEPHLEALNTLLKELEILSIQASEVLQQLKESPSDLFFKQNQYRRGPGEQ